MIRQTLDVYGAPAARNRSRKSLPAAVALLLTAVVWNATASRRVWSPEETPIAFWTWHSHTPSQEAVSMAVNHTAARTLFLRAGQIDYEGNELQRIRAVSGSFPKDIDLHLVYNATRTCLAVFEKIDPSALAVAVARAYAEDSRRALGENVHPAGVQLDFDVPTRLLSRYTRVLRALRSLLPADLKLSITGLPAWMDSSDLNETLAAADSWIPQFYGATIPERLDRAQPISSSKLVAAAVARARRMNRPFYAGLAAYGYAIQYGADGSLIALRGDLDPAFVANNADFELISRGRFERTGEWRYVYRARADSVVAGTSVREGDSMMLDLPTAESLRACATAAREQGGDSLLGICIFRLPQHSDASTLSIGEVAAALADRLPASSFRIDVNVERLGDKDLAGRRLSLSIVNDGAARSRMDDGAMGLALTVPPGSVCAIRFHGFTSVDFQRESPATDSLGNQTTILQPASLRRASVLSFRAKAWPPGASATATIEFSSAPPDTLRAVVGFTLDDGRALQEYRTFDLKNAKQL